LNLYKVKDRDARSGRALFLFHGCSLTPLYYRKNLLRLFIGMLFVCIRGVHTVLSRLIDHPGQGISGAIIFLSPLIVILHKPANSR
jgi:hypothetical protein